MAGKIDRTYVTPTFLQEYFPDIKRFRRMVENPLDSSLAASEERYMEWRESINEPRRRSGLPNVPDRDLVDIVIKSRGYVALPRPYDKKYQRQIK